MRGVGMAVETEFGRNQNAAQDQRPARRDSMHIPALPDSEIGDAGIPQEETRAAISSARNRRARSISEGLVILILRSLPMITLTST